MLHKNNIIVGIWGYGLAGKAALNYFYAKERFRHILILDRKKLEAHSVYDVVGLQAIQDLKLELLHDDPVLIDYFLTTCDMIAVSQGVDISGYTAYADMFVYEADIFGANTDVCLIGITGSFGKTTIAGILYNILNHHTPTLLAGNIGIAMLELLANGIASPTTQGVLELSSFQLERIRSFAPKLAVITNLYPNHIDRHGSQEHYAKAKLKIIEYQQSDDACIISLDMLKQSEVCTALKNYKGQLIIVHDQEIDRQAISLFSYATYLYIHDGWIIKNYKGVINKLCAIDALPTISYHMNWLIILASLDYLNIAYSVEWINAQGQKLLEISEYPQLKTIAHHRLEKISKKTITFYNDSKATVMESTLAAVDKLQPQKIILLLGGLSKGVDRAAYIQKLVGKVHSVICFGHEAAALCQMCANNNIKAYQCLSLQEAFALSVQQAATASTILLSPGGSSYDLFKDYKHRGETFKELIEAL